MSFEIKTGADPRTLPAYAQLKDEISKLSHPARPDVDWRKVEQLSLTLFEQNGVELQSAAWFTLARSHNAGLTGLNEGLSLIDALIVHQWSVCWPLAIEVRADILNLMFKRLQSPYRSWMLDEIDLLASLIETEERLFSLREALLRFGVKEIAQANTLLHQVKHSLVRLQAKPASPMPVQRVPIHNQPESSTHVYVVYPEAEVQQDAPAQTFSLKSFVSGACCALLAGAVVLACGSWYRYEHHQRAVAAQALIEQQYRAKQAIPMDRLQSWHRGMAQLENMAEQLNGLDKVKGKYLTVSELKTGIFSAIQAFNQRIPVEEQLRRYAEGSGNQLSDESQTELLLEQLTLRYQLLKQEKAQTSANDLKSQSKSKSYAADF